MPLERKAPGVIFRQPVTEPLQTGVKAVDAMIPVGRGQRELVIGDRQTGKSTVCIDTILNQKEFYDAGQPVFCIYVAIGQKLLLLLELQNVRRKKEQWLIQLSLLLMLLIQLQCKFMLLWRVLQLVNIFRDSGRPALIVYDDLSKQAVAYP